MFNISLRNPVGAGLDSDEDDVAGLAHGLKAVGYESAASSATTGQWDDAFDETIRGYQADHDLAVDGVANPGGETVSSLNGRLDELARPQASAEPRPTIRSEAPTGAIHDTGSDLERAAQPLPFSRALASGGDAFRFAADVSRRLAAPASHAVDAVRPIPSARSVPMAAARPQAGWGDDGDLAALALIGLAAGGLAKSKTAGDYAEIENADRRLLDAGFTYQPDPMGRLGRGDWFDPDGRKIDDAEKARFAAELPASAPSNDRVSAPDPARRVVALPQLAGALEAAGRGSGFGPAIASVRVFVPSAGDRAATPEARADFAVHLNATIRAETVRLALAGRRIGHADVAGIVNRVAEAGFDDSTADRHRLRNMLMTAAYHPDSRPEARHNAQTMLQVHDFALRHAASANSADPDKVADSVVVSVLADGVNGVDWAISEEIGEETEEYETPKFREESDSQPDGPRLIPVGDSGRGMNNPAVRNKVEIGNQAHEYLKNKYRHKEADGWRIERNLERRGGGWLRPDVVTGTKGYIIELKPDTLSGRIAGEVKKMLYERAFGRKVRIIYYDPKLVQTPPSSSSSGGRGGGGRMWNPKATPFDLQGQWDRYLR